jgi:hypothetical protein
VGETRVDLQHLLEALRDAYSGALEQTILIEVVANTLDSSATRIAMTAPVGALGIARGRRRPARYGLMVSTTGSRRRRLA